MLVKRLEYYLLHFRLIFHYIIHHQMFQKRPTYLICFLYNIATRLAKNKKTNTFWRLSHKWFFIIGAFVFVILSVLLSSHFVFAPKHIGIFSLCNKCFKTFDQFLFIFLIGYSLPNGSGWNNFNLNLSFFNKVGHDVGN